MPQPWMSAQETAAHLGVTTDAGFSRISDREVIAHQLNRLWMFRSIEADVWGRGAAARTSAEDSPT